MVDAGLEDVTVEAHGIQLPLPFLHRLLDGTWPRPWKEPAGRRRGPAVVGRARPNGRATGAFVAILVAVLAAGRVPAAGGTRRG
jgi:hypothetical protein